MSNEKTFIPDDVVVKIQEKARRDAEYRTLLFDNPQEALAPFGIVIPGSSGAGKKYLDTIYAMYDRAAFYQWYHEIILNEFRAETITMAPGPCLTATDQEDLDWDFEVTKYSTPTP